MTSPRARDFVEAITTRDRQALAAALAPDVDFKGLTPGRLWEAGSPDEVAEVVLGHWFEEHDRVTAVLDLTEGDVADTGHISYRLELECPTGPHVVEQQAYYRDGPAGLAHLRIMCSGFRPR